MEDLWLPTLMTPTPQEGVELAVKLSRLGMMLSRFRDETDLPAGTTPMLSVGQTIALSHVIAINFSTIAAANDWWWPRGPSRDHS